MINRLFLLSIVALAMITFSASAQNTPLPLKETPIPRTTNNVPHIQLGIEPKPEISTQILEQVANMPGVEIHKTIVSLPGALGFWVKEDINLARPDAIVRGREFAHIHPDGSLHAALSPERAIEAVQAGWAVLHPWSQQRSGWEGFVMIFTPTNADEMEVVFQLIVESYDFVTGLDSL